MKKKLCRMNLKLFRMLLIIQTNGSISEFIHRNFILQVVSVASVEAGSAHNLIPESTTFSGTFRALSKKSFYELQKRIEEVMDLLIGYTHIHMSSIIVLIKRLNPNSFEERTWSTKDM